MGISEKQQKILAFGYSKKYQSLICDGAVRTGKTSLMTVSYVDWAMREFNNTNFAVCGKTVGSAIKNIIQPYMAMTYPKKRYNIHFTRSENKMIVSRGGIKNTFYVYGGKDESSYMLIQGITLGGVLFDEVALMPQSFVEQALARCLTNANRKYWFNCNPSHPEHWFYKNWLLDAENMKALHLHFLMPDNPALGEDDIKDAERQFKGVFYQRYIMGEWVVAEGLVYPAFEKAVVKTEDRQYTEYQVSIDYGIYNPTCFGLYGKAGDKWYKVKDWQHSGRASDDGKNQPKTDSEYRQDLINFVGDLPIRRVIVDPSASSFITEIKRNTNLPVKAADNSVLDGIRATATALGNGILSINDCCTSTIAESKVYAWDDKSKEDRPIKDHDHHMDELRYFVYTNKLTEKKMDYNKLFNHFGV